MLTLGTLVCGLLAAWLLYLLAPRQQHSYKPALLWAGVVVSLALALWLAAIGYGFWPGFYLVLAALMLVWVLLPVLAQWRSKKHVG